MREILATNQGDRVHSRPTPRRQWGIERTDAFGSTRRVGFGKMRMMVFLNPPHRLTVRELPLSERPRERLAQLGAEALSEQELLACVLGRGVAGESVLISAQRLLATFGSLRGIADASIEQLSSVHGIGPAKAIQLKAAVEIARRIALASTGHHPRIESTEGAVALLRPYLSEKRKEHFVALLLDNRYQLIRVAPIAIGSLSATLVHPRELFKEAIAASAAAIIVAHNHPSGDPTPSDDDLHLTQRLVEAGKIVGIELLDHLIIGREHTTSLRASGIMGHATHRTTSTTRRRTTCATAPIG